MNWINLNVAVLDSEEFLGADPVERATWLCLLRYCAGQENGGRIEGAKQWKDRKWQQVVRVTSEEILTECELWRWDGDDLLVEFYPSEKEEEVKTRRETAKVNGARGGRPRKTNDLPVTETQEKPTLVISGKAEGEEKEKEKEKEKGREGGEEASAHPPPAAGRVVGELAALFPHAARSMTRTDITELRASMPLLEEFTEEDWTACKAWMKAPQRIRGRALWPRNRAEFVANAGEAIEKIRDWWSRDGRKWWSPQQRQQSKQAEPEGTPLTDEERDAILAQFRIK